VRAVDWSEDHVRLLDQRSLPRAVVYLEIHDARSLARAIRDMAVRGAPAIGIAAAYGVVLAARSAYRADPERWRDRVEDDMRDLAAARPTAINLKWALRRMRSAFDRVAADPVPVLLAEARAIHEEDIAANRRMGALGAALLADTRHVLTHCNTGSLATGGYGTALGVIRSAFNAGTLESVYACETRPWLQGARLTAWELRQDGIPVTLIADSAAGLLFKNGRVSWVVVGADRIAANGDVANKIGTYGLAVAARHHGLGFMVVAPSSTIDPGTASGDEIPIEDRGADELLRYAGTDVAPPGVAAWNPVFDITPAELVDVIVTEKGIVREPDRNKITALLGRPAD